MGIHHPKKAFRRGADCRNQNGEFGIQQRRSYGGEFLVFNPNDPDNVDIRSSTRTRNPEEAIHLKFMDCAKGEIVYLPLKDVRKRAEHYRSVPQKLQSRDGMPSPIEHIKAAIKIGNQHLRAA